MRNDLALVRVIRPVGRIVSPVMLVCAVLFAFLGFWSGAIQAGTVAGAWYLIWWLARGWLRAAGEDSGGDGVQLRF